MTNQEFINKIGLLANKDMKKTGVLASLTIAQAILESSWGNSGLTKRSNNLFGIKGSYNGMTTTASTAECYDGTWVTINAGFRAYPSWEESIADHSSLFLRLPRYKNLIGCRDYKLACKYVQQDGYATDPDYTTKLIRLIETYGLTKYDILEEKQLTLEEALEVFRQKGIMGTVDYWRNASNCVKYLDELIIKTAQYLIK